MSDSPEGSGHAKDSSKAAAHRVIDVFKASQLRDALHQYGDALRDRRKGIDKLNVYPVPDGDTGTNMSLTVQSVVAELKSAASDDMNSIAQAISKGAVMGARGNSGAILAQALRGVAESAKGKKEMGPHDVADALDRARKSAYEAVLKPVEGTILTVISAAATAARKSADEGHKLKEQLDAVRKASEEALARTPELLPVLKQAGVVDAGGSGFLLFVDALRYVATGEPIPGVVDAAGDDEADTGPLPHSELSELRYEVMFLLEGSIDAVAFRTAWSEVGDSIVVVGGDDLWNCHIHSDDIGKSIEVALDFGRPRQIRVTDLMEQASAEHGSAWSDPGEPSVCTAVVAVVDGNALAQNYRSFGVQRIVSGGQSANPSVAELLAAVESAPSESVIIFPNNKNVHAAARQVIEHTEKSVRVVPTKNPVEGLAALVAYDAAKDLEENFSALAGSASGVTSGEVTQAVRNALSNAGPVTAGDWLGIEVDGIAVIKPTMALALCALVEHMATNDHEILTVVEGRDSSNEATEELRQWLAANRPDIELEVHSGGQPLYPYLLGFE